MPGRNFRRVSQDECLRRYANIFDASMVRLANSKNPSEYLLENLEVIYEDHDANPHGLPEDSDHSDDSDEDSVITNM